MRRRRRGFQKASWAAIPRPFVVARGLRCGRGCRRRHFRTSVACGREATKTLRQSCPLHMARGGPLPSTVPRDLHEVRPRCEDVPRPCPVAGRRLHRTQRLVEADVCSTHRGSASRCSAVSPAARPAQSSFALPDGFGVCRGLLVDAAFFYRGARI